MNHSVQRCLPNHVPIFLSLCVSFSLSSIRSALPLGPAALSLIHWRVFLVLAVQTGAEGVGCVREEGTERWEGGTGVIRV